MSKIVKRRADGMIQVLLTQEQAEVVSGILGHRSGCVKQSQSTYRVWSALDDLVGEKVYPDVCIREENGDITPMGGRSIVVKES